jgi:hypothetical protein
MMKLRIKHQCKTDIKSDRVTDIYRNLGHKYYTNIANSLTELQTFTEIRDTNITQI